MDLTLNRIVDQFPLKVLSGSGRLDRPVRGGYASDLLSCVMKGAAPDILWVTLQFHMNVVAVAGLLDLAGVLITEGNRPDEETLARAQQDGVVILVHPQSTFTVVGRLNDLGIKGFEPAAGPR
ncbi:MAG: serine kinase [Deltaproteobacteria bacterium]|nr:serine kinase [Deltaproteobacteria bacterium]